MFLLGLDGQDFLDFPVVVSVGNCHFLVVLGQRDEFSEFVSSEFVES